MNNLDEKIQAALRREPEGGALAAEPNLAEEVLATFRGRRLWLSLYFTLLSFAAFAGAVWAGVRFINAADVSAQLNWAALALVLILLLMLLKVWFWLEMHTNRVLRELKRVELLLLSRSRD